jgi:quercetin dioxygenase-like cupin family protein
MQKRVFENPLIKDKVTVLKTTSETNGKYILVEVELQPGGGNDMHYHTTFDEEFIAVEGVLGVDVEKATLRLHPGEQAIAPMNKLHRFYNPGATVIRFHVKIVPPKDNFLMGLSIGYGLAGDGLTSSKGIPKKFAHLALLLDLTDTRLPGLLSLFNPIIKSSARRARKKGIDKQLLERYWYTPSAPLRAGSSTSLRAGS